MHSQPNTRPRRPRGEGSVYQVKSGPRRDQWQAQLVLPDGRRRSFYGATRDEVDAKLLEARWANRHHKQPPKRDPTLAEYLHAWLLERRYDLAPRSYVLYAQNVRRHIAPALGALRLRELETRHVRDLFYQLQDQGLAPRTVRMIGGILSSALRQAEEDDLVDVNVARKVRAPKVPPSEIKPLEPAEIQRFLAAARDDPLEALFLLALSTGLRRGEVCGVRWRDLDLESGRLTLAGQIQRTPQRGLAFVPTKSRTGHGLSIELAQPVVLALLAQRDRQAFAHAQAGELWREHDYVFTDQVGGPLDPMQAYRVFKRLLARAGLRDQRLHDLRHAAASLLLGWGLDLWQVSKLLRHSGIGITSDVYGHLYQQTGRELADRMGAFLEQAR